ncbi:MAG: histidinol-phosphatase HisJ family protein [Gemmatimonadota bacterium]
MINYHFHDDMSSDATQPLALHCDAADGTFVSICVTNHAEALDDGRVWRADPDEMIPRFERSAEAVRSAAERYPDLEIRLGVELEYRREWRPAFEALLDAVPFDFVLGSVHVVDGLNISGGRDVDAFFLARTEREAYEGYFREVDEMVEWGAFDVVAHFDLVKRYGHRHYGRYLPLDYRSIIEPILAKMARRGIGIEINTSGVHEAPGCPYPEPEILEWAREVGVDRLTLGSDSHSPDGFARGLARGVALAGETGWTEFTLFEGRRPARRIAISR